MVPPSAWLMHTSAHAFCSACLLYPPGNAERNMDVEGIWKPSPGTTLIAGIRLLPSNGSLGAGWEAGCLLTLPGPVTAHPGPRCHRNQHPTAGRAAGIAPLLFVLFGAYFCLISWACQPPSPGAQFMAKAICLGERQGLHISTLTHHSMFLLWPTLALLPAQSFPAWCWEVQ